MTKNGLYQIKKRFWLLYPSKDIAHAAYARWCDASAAEKGAPPVPSAAYCSRQLNCNITYISPNDIFCLLEEDGKFLKVLSTNGELGWMIYRKSEYWARDCFEEVKEERERGRKEIVYFQRLLYHSVHISKG